MDNLARIRALLQTLEGQGAAAVATPTKERRPLVFERQSFVNVSSTTAFAMMQDLASRALDRECRSPEVAALDKDQALTIHAAFEFSATATLLANTPEQQVAQLNDLSAFISGWDSAAGLEGLYTSTLNAVSTFVPPSGMVGNLLMWDKAVRSGDFAAEYSSLIAGPDGSTFFGLNGGDLARMSLTADAQEFLATLDLGPDGAGAGFLTRGLGPGGTGSQLLGGYPADYFAKGFDSGVLSDGRFIPGAYGKEGFLPSDGSLGVPVGAAGGRSGVAGPDGFFAGVPGMMGTDGFVPGNYFSTDFGTAGFLPGGIGAPGGIPGGLSMGTVSPCPVEDPGFLRDGGHGTWDYVLHSFGQAAQEIGKWEMVVGGTLVAGGAVGMATPAATTGVPEIAMGFGSIVAAAGAGTTIAGQVIENLTPAPPTTTSTTTTTTGPDGTVTTTHTTTTTHTGPAPSHRRLRNAGVDVPGLDAYLPESWTSLFPPMGCPDPYSSGLAALEDLGVETIEALAPTIESLYEQLDAVVNRPPRYARVDVPPVRLDDTRTSGSWTGLEITALENSTAVTDAGAIVLKPVWNEELHIYVV